jgi:hypothetical protein
MFPIASEVLNWLLIYEKYIFLALHLSSKLVIFFIYIILWRHPHTCFNLYWIHVKVFVQAMQGTTYHFSYFISKQL